MKVANNESYVEVILIWMIAIAALVEALHTAWQIFPFQIRLVMSWIFVGATLVLLGYELLMGQTGSQSFEKYRWIPMLIIVPTSETYHYRVVFEWTRNPTFLLAMSASVFFFVILMGRDVIPYDFFGEKKWRGKNATVKILYSFDLVGIIIMAINSWLESGYVSFVGSRNWLLVLIFFFSIHFLLRAACLVAWVITTGSQETSDTQKLVMEDFVPFFTGIMITFTYPLNDYPLKDMKFAIIILSLLMVWIVVMYLKLNFSLESKDRSELKLGVLIILLVAFNGGL